jgi:hypothetical protein
MRKVVTFLSTISISLTAIAAPATSGQGAVPNLSRCENELMASMGPARVRAWMEGASGVATGAVSGAGVYATGLAVESIGSSSDLALFQMPSDPEMTGIIISAVATGVVVAAIAGGGAYYDYRQTVDQQEALLQLFNDVRNNGNGPMFDIRVAEILKELRKLKAKAGSIFRFVGNNEQVRDDISEEAVRAALKKVVGEYASSGVLECKNSLDVSASIDRATILTFIKPALDVEVKVRAKAKVK